MQKQTEIFKRVCAGLLAAALMVTLAACKPATPADAGPAPMPDAAVSSKSLAEAGRSEPDATSGSSSGTEQTDAITVTDHLGRQVSLESPAERIVSGYYITTSMLIALGLTDRVVGVEAKADTRPIYALAAPDLLSLPNVGSAKEFNLEGCIALEPDLVILPVRLKDSISALEEVGIPVIGVNPEDQESLMETIRMIGRAADAEERASALISDYEDKLTQVQQIAAEDPVETTVYLAGNSSFLSTATAKMYQNSLIEAAGGTNAAAEIDDTYWATVSYEQLLAYDPDRIVLASDASYTKEDLLSDPQLAALKAVQNRAVYQFPDAFEAWDSPTTSSALGMLWMSSLLHEQAYPLEQMREDAAAFYQQFYGISIDTEEITR